MNDQARRTGPRAETPARATGDTGREARARTTGDTVRPLVRLQSSLPAEPSSVRQIRHSVAELAATAGVHGDQLDAVRLAVSEAVTNIVLHAYAGTQGEVHVTAEVATGELWVLIADDGRGIRVAPESRGLGLGFALMSEVCDGFSVVERAGAGTELRLRFKIAARSPQDQGPAVSSATDPPSPTFSTTMYCV